MNSLNLPIGSRSSLLVSKILLALLNLFLLPLYAAVFAIFLFLVWLPLFPCRTGIHNLREQMNVGFFAARFRLAFVFMSYFFYLIEAIIVWPLGLTTVSNMPEFEKFLEEMDDRYHFRGLLLLTAHYGNIESLGEKTWLQLMAQFGRGFHTLAQPSRLALFTTLLSWYRRKRHLQTLLTNRKDLVKRMLTLIKEGESLGLLVDQKPQSGGIFIEFFASPAAFPFRGPDIAVRGGMPSLYVVSRRIVPGYFEFLFSEGVNPHCKEFQNGQKRLGNLTAGESAVAAFPDGDPTTPVARMLAGYAAWLETLIRRHPHQWSWDYRKWSRALPPVQSDDP